MILVTGGTGSFGGAFLARHYLTDSIRVLSSDEEKQRAMALRFPDVDYVIGDVRDLETVRHAVRGVDRIFHAAALKQVPPLEKAPLEAVRTNVIGTDNVCRAAWEAGAKVVTLSTDKAVEPVGVMGATKMLAEAVTSAWGFTQRPLRQHHRQPGQHHPHLARRHEARRPGDHHRPDDDALPHHAR